MSKEIFDDSKYGLGQASKEFAQGIIDRGPIKIVIWF